MTFRLAASAEMLYLDLPFVERVARIHDRGFEVEIWDWTTKDLAAIAATGAVISSMTGYVREISPLPTASTSCSPPRRTPSSVAGTCSDFPAAESARHWPRRSKGLPVRPEARSSQAAMWLAAAPHTVAGSPSSVNAQGGVFMPGEPEHRRRSPRHAVRARPPTPWRWYEAVDNPHLRLNLDLYHAQIGEGNLIELINGALPTGSARSRSPTSPDGANRAPERSTTGRSLTIFGRSATTASSVSRGGRARIRMPPSMPFVQRSRSEERGRSGPRRALGRSVVRRGSVNVGHVDPLS